MPERYIPSMPERYIPTRVHGREITTRVHGREIPTRVPGYAPTMVPGYTPTMYILVYTPPWVHPGYTLSRSSPGTLQHRG